MSGETSEKGVAAQRKNGEKDSDETVRQTIVETLEAPMLKGVSTEEFVRFKRSRHLYEKKMAEKKANGETNAVLTSYRNSMEDSLLREFLTAHWIKRGSVDEITKDDTKACVDAQARTDSEVDQDFALVDAAIKEVVMDMRIGNPEKRVIKLSWDYRRALEVAGLPDLPTERPYVAIKHIMSKVKPSRLRKRMKKIIAWKKNENFHSKDYGEFVRALAKVAREVERAGRADRKETATSDSEIDSESDDDKPKGDRKRKKKKGKKRKASSSDDGGERKKLKEDKGSKKELPPCLNKSCGGRHYMDKCPNTSPEEGKRLVKEYKERKKKENGKDSSVCGAFRLGAEAIDDHSALFSATFASGRVESVVLADQGADCNFLPPSVVSALCKALPELEVVTLPQTQLFGTAVKDAAPLPCSRKVICDVHLRIRHGTQMLLRNVTWLISERETPHVIIGRPVLAALGLDNRKLLAAACDDNHGAVDVAALLAQKRNEGPNGCTDKKSKGTVCSILEDPLAGSGAMYHSQGANETDGLENTEVYINLGEDAPGAVENELRKKVEEAKQNGLSQNEGDQLLTLLMKYKEIFG